MKESLKNLKRKLIKLKKLINKEKNEDRLNSLLEEFKIQTAKYDIMYQIYTKKV